MKGTQPHTSAMTHTANASAGSDSQPMSASGGRRMPKKASKRPNSGLNMKRNDTPTRAGLMAKGRMRRVRTVNRSRPPGASSRATPEREHGGESDRERGIEPGDPDRVPEGRLLDERPEIVLETDERPRNVGAREPPGAERENQGIDERPDRGREDDRDRRQHQEVLEVAIAKATAAARRSHRPLPLPVHGIRGRPGSGNRSLAAAARRACGGGIRGAADSAGHRRRPPASFGDPPPTRNSPRGARSSAPAGRRPPSGCGCHRPPRPGSSPPTGCRRSPAIRRSAA